MNQFISVTRKLFTEDPATRFAREFDRPADCWRETWRRYKELEYTRDEAYEYLLIAAKCPVRRERFRRWLDRTEVYNLAQVAIRNGIEEMHIRYFGKLGPFVLKELTKNRKKT